MANILIHLSMLLSCAMQHVPEYAIINEYLGIWTKGSHQFTSFVRSMMAESIPANAAQWIPKLGTAYPGQSTFHAQSLQSANNSAAAQAVTPNAYAETDSLTCAEMARTPLFPQAKPKCMRIDVTPRACAKLLPL